MNAISLQGKRAIVTGGSRGIGFAISNAMISAGARVVITGRSENKLAAARKELGEASRTFSGDAANEEQARDCVAFAMSEFGHVDILVNNAAVNPQRGPTTSLPLPLFDHTIRTNLRAPLMWAQLVWSSWMEEGGGVILNVSSLGHKNLVPHMGAYNTSKAGLEYLTKVLAAEMGPQVRVNSIAPGLVKTDMSEPAWIGREERWTRHMPMQRLGVPEDVAAAALFLISDQASWITGETLHADGGAWVQWGRPRS